MTAEEKLTEELQTMEGMVKFFAAQKYRPGMTSDFVVLMDRYARQMRELINEKTKVLQVVQNGIETRPPEVDPREEYIAEIEAKLKRLENQAQLQGS